MSTTPAISQEDWDAAVAERASEDPKPPVQEAPPVEALQSAAEQPAPEGEKVDPLAGLHPDVQAKLAKFDELAAAMPQVLNELKAAKGRIGAMQSEWDKAKQAGSQQPTQTQIAQAAKDPENWASLKEDFPEWGKGISDFVEARLGQIAGNGLSADQIEQLVAQRAEALTAGLEQTFNKRLVAIKHPTWERDVQSLAFQEWFGAQDAATQALAQSPDPMDAITMLNAYQADMAKPVQRVEQTRQQRLASAVTTTRQGSAPVTKSFEEMSPAEQWDYLAKNRDKQV